LNAVTAAISRTPGAWLYQVLRNDLTHRVNSASAKPEVAELECLRLRTEGLSYEEVGFAMEVRTGTVGALLARAPQKIRKRAESRGGPDLHLAAAVCYLAQC